MPNKFAPVAKKLQKILSAKTSFRFRYSSAVALQIILSVCVSNSNTLYFETGHGGFSFGQETLISAHCQFQ